MRVLWNVGVPCSVFRVLALLVLVLVLVMLCRWYGAGLQVFFRESLRVLSYGGSCEF